MENASAPAPSPASPAAGGRLVSLDALRGFDMFWILGGDAVLRALAAIWEVAPFRVLGDQMEHRDWAGFTFYDLIFPLFVFVAGVSAVFAVPKLVEKHGRVGAAGRVLRRAALLFLLGLIYAGGFTNPWPEIRLLGVLQRIALAYGAAGVLLCFCRARGLAVATVALLVGYWALLNFVPVRAVPAELLAINVKAATAPTTVQAREIYAATTARTAPRIEPGANLANQLDLAWLPGRLYDRYWDPEGILSTWPAVATCLLGMLAGIGLRRTDLDDRKKITRLAVAGVAAVAVGWLWHLQFPIVKKIWTSSYVLVAGGWSTLLLAAFYWAVDVRGWRGWCAPFVWIGMNPISLYLINGMLLRPVPARFVGGDVKAWLDTAVAPGCSRLAYAGVGLALVLALARFLHARKIFLRV